MNVPVVVLYLVAACVHRYYDSESASMKGSFALLKWSYEDDFTNSFIFSSEDTS